MTTLNLFLILVKCKLLVFRVLDRFLQHNKDSRKREFASAFVPDRDIDLVIRSHPRAFFLFFFERRGGA